MNFASPSLAGSARGATLQLGGGSFGAARATLEGCTGQLPNGARALRPPLRPALRRLPPGRDVGGERGVRQRRVVRRARRREAHRVHGARAQRAGVLRGARQRAAREPALQPARRRRRPVPRELRDAELHAPALAADASAGLTAYGFQHERLLRLPVGRRRARAALPLGVALGRARRAAHASAQARSRSTPARTRATYAKDHAFDDAPGPRVPGATATRGTRSEASAFAQGAPRRSARATLFGDLQVRTARFRYEPTAGYGAGRGEPAVELREPEGRRDAARGAAGSRSTRRSARPGASRRAATCSPAPTT